MTMMIMRIYSFVACLLLVLVPRFTLAEDARPCQAEWLNNQDVSPPLHADPITILFHTESTVTFAVSQTWSDDVVCSLGTHYLSPINHENACPTSANAAPGNVAHYTAQCVDGYANVDLYVYDPAFPTTLQTVSIADLCEQTPPDKTHIYQFRIPCAEHCARFESWFCVDTPVVQFTFEDDEQIQSWLFGESGGDDENHYLRLGDGLTEVSKTFTIPIGTTQVTFDFDFVTMNDLAESQKLLLRVADYYFNITAALLLPNGGSKTEYFGEAQVFMQRLDASTLHGTVMIPPVLYTNNGYLSLGIRTHADSTAFVAGLDNVKIAYDCESNLEGGGTGVTKTGGGGGDPHFAAWNSTSYSFHGECDLVMVHSDDFHNGAGLDLHVRTTIHDYFSYAETAALRVGSVTLEFHKDFLYMNGAKYTPDELPITFGDDYNYTVTSPPPKENKQRDFLQYYKVKLHQESMIRVKFYKHFMSIEIVGHTNDFNTSVGLLGDYETGNLLSRYGEIMTDPIQFGYEWQVNPSQDGQLFVESRAPQLPYELCRMPTASRPARRKLRGADAVLWQAAQNACSSVDNPSDFDLCVEDVMATGDIGLATLW